MENAKPNATASAKIGGNPSTEGNIDLYLQLLKKSLTNTLFEKEPDVNDENRLAFTNDFIKHYINGAAISMLPIGRLDNLQYCMVDTINRKIPGDFIETGVWRGGATIFMRGVLKAFDVNDRAVWVADSFEGLPEPDAGKFPTEAKYFHGPIMRKRYNHFACSLEDVQANFSAYNLLDGQVRFLKGWFKNTLPNAPIQKLAVMRLDGDFYESTMDALTNLYDKLSVGGYVIIDDYGEDDWTYCRKAVEEFRTARGISDDMIPVDTRCRYWQRSS